MQRELALQIVDLFRLLGVLPVESVILAAQSLDFGHTPSVLGGFAGCR